MFPCRRAARSRSSCPASCRSILWESVRPYTLSMNCPVAVDTALADYRKLNSTASPCILRSEEAVQAMEEVKKIASLSGYYKSRDELEQAVYPLSKAESEVVFWHLRGRLEDMLLEVIVPAVLEQEKKPPANLEAQYRPVARPEAVSEVYRRSFCPVLLGHREGGVPCTAALLPDP